MYLLVIGLTIITGGVDFSSRQVSVLFTPGNNRATAFIRLECDRELEGNEEFDLTLSILSSTTGVSIGSRSMATAIITDATSKRSME